MTTIPGWTLRGDGPQASRWHPVWSEPSGVLAIEVGESTDPLKTFGVEFAGMARFEIAFAMREITIIPLGEQVSRNTLNHLLVDQIWPRILAHDGELVLHAAGIATSAGAVLVAGPSGQGKSTLAASLHQRGHALMGDDAIVISMAGDEAHCRAVYPSMRLFPDSIASLFAPDTGHSEVAHYTEKRNVDLSQASWSARPARRLAAIFILAGEDGRAEAGTRRLAQSTACMKLVEHSFWLDPLDVSRTATKLSAAAAVANATPAFELSAPRSFSRLDEVHAAMFAALE